MLSAQGNAQGIIITIRIDRCNVHVSAYGSSCNFEKNRTFDDSGNVRFSGGNSLPKITLIHRDLRSPNVVDLYQIIV